jgi:autotransporter-associated beta strand protein
MRVTLASAVSALAGILSAAGGCFALCGGSALANTSSPPVLGIDVYNGNGTMNWSQIASNGIQFAWAKATQGNYYQDAQLPNNESNGTGNGVYIGAYDFADPTACSPLTEATYFVNYASQHGALNTGKLLPTLDMESVGSTINGASSLTTWINNWATDVYNLSGVHPLLYCSPGFFNGHGITSTGVPLWEADWTYPSNLSNSGPPSNSWSPWSTWTFWQYSNKGSVGGDPSTVDLDAYNGTHSQMIANDVIPALAWTGNVNGAWNMTNSGTQNWNYGTTSSNTAYYFDGRAVVFQDTNLVKDSQVTNSTVTISSIVMPQSIAFTANSVNYTFAGSAIAGAGGITINGTSTVTLNNGTSASPNTYGGAVVVNKGQLVLEQAWSLGNAPSATVAGGGAIALTNASGAAVSFGKLASGGGTIPLTIAGAGLTASPAGAINSTRGNNTYSGAISLSANATINSVSTVSGDGLSLPGGIATNGHTLTFSGAGATTVSGAIGGGGLTMAGAGTVTLSNANSLTGAVQINSGTLKITNGSALGAGPITLGGGKLTFAAPVIIGVNIAADGGTVGSSSGEQPEQMGTAAIAGIPQAAMSHWNDFTITRFKDGENNSNSNPPPVQSVPTSPTPLALNDSSGKATTAQVVGWSGNNSYSVYGASQASINPNAQLLNGILGSVNSNAFPNHPATFTIGNIPYTTGYNVYVYFNNDQAGQGTQISLQSGGYVSPMYYVSTLGKESVTASPFFISGTSSTTAGAYVASDYVQIPVPATGASGATAQFTVTLSAAPSGANVNTPGIAAIQVVGQSGAALSNSVTVSSNSTIDVTGVNSATMGPLSIGGDTLSVTGGSTGAGAPFNLTLGPATLAGNPTFDIADNGAGNGTLTLNSLNDGGSNRIITKTNSGTLEVQGASHLSTGTALNVNAGTLRFNNISGPATIGAAVTATVSGIATLELAGTVSAFSSSAGPSNNRVNISNISTASAGLLVTGINQQVGKINGNGTTQVNAGGSLIANHIVQDALVIGGGSGTSAVVTIDASDPSGNSLAVNSIEPLAGEAIPAVPLAPNVLLATGAASTDLIGNTSNSDSSAASAAPVSSSTASGPAMVPEPNSLILLAVALILLFPRKSCCNRVTVRQDTKVDGRESERI